jgi:hypothetical protein
LVNENCDHKEEFDGVLCDPTVAIRRVGLHKYSPRNLFDGLPMRTLRWDDDYIASLPDKEAYLLDVKNYGHHQWLPKHPAKSWGLSLVTGHKYKIHWSSTGVDFEEMHLDVSQRW